MVLGICDSLPLHVHLLTFEIKAKTRLRLPPFKGSTFRGAWKAQITRAYCTASPEERARPDHAQHCPACYLTEWERHSEARKPYALRPPLTRETDFPPGAVLSFGMVLFGPAWLLLPYVLTAVRAMGEAEGIGAPIGPHHQRGKFTLQAIYAENPFQQPPRVLIYSAKHPLVTPPQNGAIKHSDILRAAQAMLAATPGERPRIRLRFITPLRLIHQGRLMRLFAPEPFFRRLLERLFMLAEDFGNPPLSDARAHLRRTIPLLQPHVAQVQVVEDATWWWDVRGHSSRLHRVQPLGGLIGEVVLEAPRETWEALLPPLLWGEIVHVGKNVVKGEGVYEVEASGQADERTGGQASERANKRTSGRANG